jgi:hypothetical protein
VAASAPTSRPTVPVCVTTPFTTLAMVLTDGGGDMVLIDGGGDGDGGDRLLPSRFLQDTQHAQ